MTVRTPYEQSFIIMTILIIEDDLKVQAFLKDSLEHDFAPVFAFSEFPRDPDLLNIEAPQTIILDRLLGNFDSKNGISFLKKKFPDSAILILSAINNPAERSELLDLGADDYLGKPFSLMELKSRIRALSRRTSTTVQVNYLKLNSTILDLHLRTISTGEEKVNLSSKEFELFYVLAKNVGRVYSKFELMDKVWEANLEIESNVLEVTIMNLRKKLADLKSDVQICSKRNIGYWIEI